MLDFQPTSVLCAQTLFSPLLVPALSPLPSDLSIAVILLFPPACPECLWLLFTRSTKSSVLSPVFSWHCGCVLVVAGPPFLRISLSTVSPVPQHGHAPLSDREWIELLEGGRGADHPLLPSAEFLFYHQKHVFVETYGLNYWPCFLSLLLSCCRSLPPGCSSGSTARTARGSCRPSRTEWLRAA